MTRLVCNCLHVEKKLEFDVFFTLLKQLLECALFIFIICIYDRVLLKQLTAKNDLFCQLTSTITIYTALCARFCRGRDRKRTLIGRAPSRCGILTLIRRRPPLCGRPAEVGPTLIGRDDAHASAHSTIERKLLPLPEHPP